MKHYVIAFLCVLVMTSNALGRPIPEQGESALEFLDRYELWLESIAKEDLVWDSIIEISNRLEDTPGWRRDLPVDPNDSQWALNREFVQNNQELIKSIHAYSTKKYIGLPREVLLETSATESNSVVQPLDILLPHLVHIRNHVRLLTIDAAIAGEESDIDRALDSMEAMRQIQTLIPVTNTLIEGMFEIACSSLGVELVNHEYVKLRDFNKDQLLRLQNLYVQEPLELTTSDLIENERWATSAVLESFYQGSRGGRITLRGTQRFLETFSMVSGEQQFDDLESDAKLIRGSIARLHEQRKIQEQFWTALEQDFSQKSFELTRFTCEDYLRQFDFQEMTYTPAVLMLNSVQLWYGRLEMYYTHQKAMDLLIALHLQRLRDGDFPSRFDELDRQLLVHDPIDPYTGQPLTYEIKDDYVLIYSFGPDRADSSGDPMLNDDGDPEYYPDFVTLDKYQSMDKGRIQGDWILFPLVAN